MYKVFVGINDVLSKKEVYLFRHPLIYFNTDNTIATTIKKLMELPNDHPGLFISLCCIPGASIRKYNWIKNDLGEFSPCKPDEEQIELQNCVSSANDLILRYSTGTWIDIEGNQELSNRINCNTSLRSRCDKRRRAVLSRAGQAIPLKAVRRTNFNRLKDGLHFTSDWRSYAANHILGSMTKEVLKLERIISRPRTKV